MKEEEFLKEYWIIEDDLTYPLVRITLNETTYAIFPLEHLNLKSVPDYAITSFMKLLAEFELYEQAAAVRDEIKTRNL